MINPFIKKDNSSVWIAALVVGAITAGALAYFYFTAEDESLSRESDAKKPTDYLNRNHPHKRKKTDVDELEALAGN
jgi:hypothetical protein